jgi:ABC-type amino acid transport substrate-binding protein
MKARSVDSNKQLFDLLKKKRCDVIIIARITSIPMVIDYIKTQKAQLYQSVLQTYPLFHYLHKKNSHLTENLNKTLKNMQKEGLIDEIRSQFIAKKSREARSS